MEIQYGSVTAARCALRVDGARNAGKHALVLAVEMTLFDYPPALAYEGPPRSDVFFDLFTGELETVAGKTPTTTLVQRVLLTSQVIPLQFRADLDREHLQRIEEYRLKSSDGDVPLTLHLQVLVTDPAGKDRAASKAQLRTVISASDWVKILANTGFDERFTMEFVTKRANQPEALSRAAEEFEKAKTCYRHGDWTSTLLYCRRVTECLPNFPKQPTPQSNDVETRERNMLAHFTQLLHAGAHAIGRPSRQNARLCLMMVAELLNRHNEAPHDTI